MRPHRQMSPPALTPASKLLDGQLPLDGWRSTWTAWFKSNPQLLFNLGKKREMNKIRIYFQPYERAAELEEVKVYIADEEMNFELLDSFPGGPGLLQQGKYAEFDMNGITTQAIRLEPSYDGWGHMWGEVEFWVYDTGEFGSPCLWAFSRANILLPGLTVPIMVAVLGPHTRKVLRLKIEFIMIQDSGNSLFTLTWEHGSIVTVT